MEHFSHPHPLIFHEKVDPVDDWYSCSCNGCGYRIFSTPSYICSSSECGFILHRRCANFPKKLEPPHFMHKDHPLTLVAKPYTPLTSSTLCENCNREPQNFIYMCLEDPSPSFFLHLICALPLDIRVLRQSHQHELIPIRGKALFTCGACGDRHEGLSYFCNMCPFWIHQECAHEPTTIQFTGHEEGKHTLILSYASFRLEDWGILPSCRLCKQTILEGLGYYFCTKCRYYAHLKCATSDKKLYRIASSLTVEIDPEILHLPTKDEHTSLLPFVLKIFNITEAEGSNSPKLFEHVHDHPLTFHQHFDGIHQDKDERQLLVCDACIELISPPYYNCSKCPNFFLHSCCAHLPPTIIHPHHKNHFFLLRKPLASEILPQYICSGCERHCSGFSYKCETCAGFSLDIMCALLPDSTTHEAHVPGHILFLEDWQAARKKCCNRTRVPRYAWTYRCRVCPDYCLDIVCSLLPMTIRHKYDQHDLKLVTTSEEKYDPDQHFCEICEVSILGPELWESDLWYYHCDPCNTSFHVGCIPSVSPRLAKIKFGGTIRISRHDCPLISIRMLTWHSYPCAICKRMMEGLKDNIAFKCSRKCGYFFHYECAVSNLVSGMRLTSYRDI